MGNAPRAPHDDHGWVIARDALLQWHAKQRARLGGKGRGMDTSNRDSMDRATDAGTSGPRRLVARVVYDTRAQPLPAGVRTVLQRARRLLFVAEDSEVILQVSPAATSGQIQVMGQVLAAGLPVHGATLRAVGSASVAPQATDQEGAFRLAGLPSGDYTLEIETAEHILELPTLDFSER